MMTCILKRVVAMLIVCVMAATAAFADGWIPKQNEKGKWGYVNDAGKWVIRPKFLGATKMYYYRILRRTEPGYPDEGYCAMAKDKNGWGVIVSATGNFINTQRFENVGETAWGNAAVKSNGKWGVIDILTRKEVFECIHDSVLTMISPEIIKVINNGKPDIYRLNNVPLKQNLGDYDGYFLMGRRYLFDADLNLLHVFDSNSDIEVVGKTFIDDKGHFLYDSNFNKINEKEFRSWSYTRESPLISIQDGYDSYRLYDCRNQRYVTETSYREIVLVHEDGYGIATIRQEDGTLVGQPFTGDGELLEKNPPIKDNAIGLHFNTLCQDPTTNKCGFLGPKGRIIVPMEYDNVSVKTRGQVLEAVKNGKVVLFDYEGNQLGARNFQLDHGFVATNDKKKKAFVDESEKVISPWFDAILAFWGDGAYREKGPLYIVKSGGKYGLYNRVTRKQVAPCIYDAISNFEVGNRIIVQQGTLCGVLDTQGKVIVTPKYMGITPYQDTMKGIIACATVSRAATGLYRVCFLDLDGKPIPGMEDLLNGAQCNFGYKKLMGDLMNQPFGVCGAM